MRKLRGHSRRSRGRRRQLLKVGNSGSGGPLHIDDAGEGSRVKIQLEDAGPVYIAWPLDADAARWLRDTNLGAVHRWTLPAVMV